MSATLSVRTVAFLLRDEQVLLGFKKRGFGTGKLLGIGGKVEPGETLVAAAVREVAEEIGVRVAEKDLVARGVLRFRFPAKPSWDQDVHVFLVETWKGSPSDSAEIRPLWFSRKGIPFDEMWDDARHWLPKVLAGESVDAKFYFADDMETVKAVEW